MNCAFMCVVCGVCFPSVSSNFFLVPRDDPPGQTCSQAIQKLTEFTQNVSSGIVPLEFVSQSKDLRLKDFEQLQNLDKLDVLEQKLNDCTSTDIANFEQLVICHMHIQNLHYIFHLNIVVS